MAAESNHIVIGMTEETYEMMLRISTCRAAFRPLRWVHWGLFGGLKAALQQPITVAA